MTIYKFHLKKSPIPGVDCCVVHTTNFSIQNISKLTLFNKLRRDVTEKICACSSYI